MNSNREGVIEKASTGIQGFDNITGGGLPRASVTLLVGSPGSGKTLFALQTLTYGARELGEPGIFVAFEENTTAITRNAATFGWDLHSLIQQNLLFIDAQPPTELHSTGNIDLEGLLAIIAARAESMGARRVVFDGLDVYMNMMSDFNARRRELYRLQQWLVDTGLTVIITAKQELGVGRIEPNISFLQFMVDCVVHFEHRVVNRVSLRSVRVVKYRGSGFFENESPMIIGARGLDVAGPIVEESAFEASVERISTGIDDLDDMFVGGYLRNSVILISGTPGTAKSTLAASFAFAACERGEQALMVSFDEFPAEIIRNAASVNIDLQPHIKSGLLKIYGFLRESKSAEAHLLQLRELISEHSPRAIVIDPVSALLAAGGEQEALDVITRLLRLAKQAGATTLLTTLLQSADGDFERARLPISTIADTWIHVTYVAQAGERNRALSIIKSRGTGHSNQVRELILTDNGVELAQVYAAGGAVLMGTLRWEKEEADRQAERAHNVERDHLRTLLELEEAELNLQLAIFQKRIQAKQMEMSNLLDDQAKLRQERADQLEEVSRLRRGQSSADLL